MPVVMKIRFQAKKLAHIFVIMQIVKSVVMKFIDVLARWNSADRPPERLRRDIGLDASERRKGWWEYW
tara:strand:- start:372 stop:575 length:204 start_codon:yes stop_codon:yes gene_type:complete